MLKMIVQVKLLKVIHIKCRELEIRGLFTVDSLLGHQNLDKLGEIVI